MHLYKVKFKTMIKNVIALLVVSIAVVGKLMAQEHIVHGATPDLYLTHDVVAKETWYSLGRTYNLSPKEIAIYNKLSIDKPLEIAQQVKVPLTSTNFSQGDNKGAGETLVPVYHIVAEKEWMYRISVNHNKVPIEKLEKWNNITRDEAKAGMKLVVGYLKVKDANASLTKKAPSETSSATQDKSVAENKKTVEEPKKAAEEPKKQEPVVAETPKQQTPQQQPSSQSSSAKNGGYFKQMYTEAGTTSSGVAGIFKSTSGWNDGKYYVLMSNVVVGTIVKITFPQTNKAVYAKVLGELPDMKESAGLALRISDAAASELGASTNKFSVNVKY